MLAAFEVTQYGTHLTLSFALALQALDISYRYGPRFGIEAISLHVERGTWLGIIGSNGSGKTTLMKLLSGLLPPASGRVLLDGEPLESFSANRRARHLAYVPQSYQPVFEFTVEQTILLGRMPYRSSYGGFESDDDISSADAAIELLELEKLRHEPVTKLSGGELQRVMIARAIAQGSGTLLLDEPTSHLDIAHQQSVLESIRGRKEMRALTVVASLHDLNLAAMYCDRIAVMSKGRLLGCAAPSEVLTPATLRQAFGVDLDIEPRIYGDAPAVRYRYGRAGVADGA